LNKYTCAICGYVYDPALGDPERDIPAGTAFEALSDDWTCPLCGAAKDDFFAEESEPETAEKTEQPALEHDDELTNLSAAELSVLFSNLAKGCEKQYRVPEAEAFGRMADYYATKVESKPNSDLTTLAMRLKADLENGYAEAKLTASETGDRGALRALTWGEKVSKILSGLIPRYERSGETLLAENNIYVCEICGFVYIGKTPPEICPVCKVPNLKIRPVQRRAN